MKHKFITARKRKEKTYFFFSLLMIINAMKLKLIEIKKKQPSKFRKLFMIFIR